MDLGVTMGISLRFKAAQPYLWRGGWGRKKKNSEDSGPRTTTRSGPGPGEMRFPLASSRQGWGGGWERACASIWVLPYGVFSSRAFPAAPEKTRHPGRHCLRGAYSTACRHFRGHTEAPPVASEAPSRRARPPQLTLRAAACAQPHVGGVCGCAGVCECGRGRRPSSCSIRPFY